MITAHPPRGRFAGLLFFLGMTLATAGLAQQNAEPVPGPLSLAELSDLLKVENPWANHGLPDNDNVKFTDVTKKIEANGTTLLSVTAKVEYKVHLDGKDRLFKGPATFAKGTA